MRSSFQMRDFFSLILGILIILQPGCRSRSQEIPVFTYSREARKIFREARAKYEFHHTEEADALLTEALKKDPLFAQAHIYKAFTASTSIEIDHSITKATANASRATEAEQILIEALKAFRWENNPEKAIHLYHQLIELCPKDARPRWLLGLVYIRSKETSKAIEQLEKAVEINPEFAPAYQDLGYRSMIRGDYEKAEASFQRYLALAPDEPNPHDCIADLYTKMGRYDEAIGHYQKALELDPAFAISKRNIGINLCYLGNFDQGREVLLEAAEKETNPYTKLITMEKIIHSFLYEEDYQKALEAANEVLNLAMDNSVLEEAALYQLAKCTIYCELDDCENANKSISECRKMFQDVNLAPYYKKFYEGECLFWEAWIAAKRNRFQVALRKAAEYRNLLEARNDLSRVKYHTALLGYIALEEGKYRWAYELFKNADIEDPFFIYYTAIAKQKTGDFVEAAKYFRKAGNWNSDSFYYALVRQRALDRKTN